MTRSRQSSLDGADEAFDERVQVGTATRQANRCRSGAPEHGPNADSEDRVAIHDEVGLPQQESIHRVGQIAQDLKHPFLVGFAYDTGHLNA